MRSGPPVGHDNGGLSRQKIRSLPLNRLADQRLLRINIAPVDQCNTVDGKLVAIPQEVVAYGLFVNVDMFNQCGLSSAIATVWSTAVLATFSALGSVFSMGLKKLTIRSLDIKLLKKVIWRCVKGKGTHEKQ